MNARNLAHGIPLVLALALGACSDDSPTAPSPPGGGTPVTLTGLSLSSPSVVGGTAVQVTATLSAAAPAGGAAVALASSHAAAGGATLTVAAGATSGTASLATTPVQSATAVTISGTYGGGAAQTAQLMVTPPVLQAGFTVTSTTRPAGQNQNVCVVSSAAGDLDCEFDGSGSTNARTWEWTYIVGQQARNVTLDTPRHRPASDCAFFGSPAAGTPFVAMEVRLRVRDANGQASTETVNRDVRIVPNQGFCGWT